MEVLMDYIEFWQERYPSILEYTWQHLFVSLVSVILGAVLAIPLGIYLTRIKSKAIKNITFNVTNIFQTIPTIALLALMIPLLGIGMKPAIVALFLYSLLPLLRNTFAGIQSVDPEVIESAKGIGYSPIQRLMQIEIPLAFPYIMSGLRITTVYIISWATIAAVIGAGGLGGMVIAGLGFNDKFLIFTGTIMAVIMALIADFLMGILEKKVAYK
ncbi:ABC transporter permease [Aquibacillus albus]|uniref:Osmoprotectant transport system permease protein n=1 Tax=Aquibacillus albus TaxID=1168171 RepID=A0ABS2MXS8_9BACI|nr:ABC transporter permease [Aquibacillus albus]MBM7570495.1 osmoprotectant transport system permease protein [Aquibacillus albus]